MSFDTLLIHTCDVGALSQGAQDAYGTPAETWPLSYTTEPCRLQSTTGREVKVGAKVVISDWKLFVDNGCLVDEQDRISNIRLRDNAALIDASTYEILLVLPKSDGVGQHHKELALVKVT